MELDACVLLGLFNFRVSKGFAVDDECHSFVISHSFDTTASMHRRLALAATDKCPDEALCHHKAVKAGRLLPLSPALLKVTAGKKPWTSSLPLVQLTRK